jgi:hypothetical protein
MLKVEQNRGNAIALNLTSKFSKPTLLLTLFHSQQKSLKLIINLKVLIKKQKNHSKAIHNQINKPSVHSPKTLINPSFPTTITGIEEALSPYLRETLKNKFKGMQKKTKMKLICFRSRKIQIRNIMKKLSRLPKGQRLVLILLNSLRS